MERFRAYALLTVAALILWAGALFLSSPHSQGIAFAETIVRPSQATSTDATLAWLTLEDVALTFSPGTTNYTASVEHAVEETIMRASATDSEAGYIVRLDNKVQDTSLLPTPTPTDDPPMSFSVSGAGHDSISLQWGAAPRNRGIVSGKIQVHEHMGSGYQYVASYDAGILAGELRVSHLKLDTLYKFILIFSNQAGDVVRRQTVTARTQATQSTATPTPTPLTTQTTVTPTATPTPLAAPTDAAVNFRVSDVGHDSISLQWEAAPLNLGITSAEIAIYEHNGNGYQYVDHYSMGISGRNFFFHNLKSDTLYRFSLRFLDVDNDVVWSQTVTARTQATQTPQATATPTSTPLVTQATATPTPTDDPPMNFSVSGVGHDSISLQWGAAPRNRGIVSGKIQVHEHMGSGYQYVASYDAGILAGELRVSHLKLDTLYKFILIFSNQAGDVVRRQTATARTQATQTPQATATPTSTLPVTQATPTATPTPLAAPTDAAVNFRVSDVGHDSISLQWEAAPRDLGITSAEIAIYEHNGSEYHYVDHQSMGISGRSFFFHDLKSDTLYKFSLRFLDVDNDVVWSQTVTARTHATQTTATPSPTPHATQATATPTPTPTSTDDPPMNFSVSGVGHDSISLQWEAAPRNRGIVSGKIQAHEHMGSGYQYVASYDAGILAGELRVSHLRPDTLYKFILIFSNQAGDVVRRQTATARTQATQTPQATATPTSTPLVTQATATATPVPPSAPVLAAEAVAGAVELSWDAVPGAVRYELWTWTSEEGWQQIGGNNLTATAFRHDGLAAGTTYFYTARTHNSAGEASAWSEHVSATVPSGLAAPGMKVVISKDAVELSWDAVPGAVRYELWTWTSEDGWQQIGGNNLTATAFRHDGLAAGTTYFYSARTHNSAGETSVWSEYVSATVPAGQ